MNNLTVKKLENNFDFNAYQEYMLKKSIDDFLHGTISNELHPITSKVVEYINLPDIGSHLVTPRRCYTHHGIYIGNKEVIQYSGFAGGTLNSHDIVPTDGSKRSPIEKVHLSEFTRGCGYSIKEHPYAKSSKKEIVENAFSRLNESKYNLLFNNCEHFANWCVYGTKESKQVNDVVRVAGSISKPVKAITDMKEAIKSINYYIKGDISGEKFLDDIGHISTTSASSFYYGIAGQVAIPIPIVGYMIGSTVGYVIGNMLYNSGLFSLTGDATIVKQAKNRRKKIERISSILLPIMQENRKKLEEFISQYMSERKEVFLQAFSDYDQGFKENNTELIINSLSKINKAYDKELTYKSIGEFTDWLDS